jgi:glucose/arabinose dehydrogenase
VLLIDPDGGEPRSAGAVDQAAPDGEGGLLGVAVSPDFERDRLLYFYATRSGDNAVLRGRLGRDDRLGTLETVLDGIPKGFIHNGGRLRFGPDDMLYVATGETGDGGQAQDRGSLGGKILRITPQGRPAPGNPDPDSPVWTRGHRNVQGLTFDDDGNLWASEFGQSTYDELNLIRKGSDYGWPVVEGRGGGNDFVDPVFQWSPDEASPSGLAWSEGTLFLAALRGQRIWTVDSADGEPEARDWFAGEFGRIRDVAIAPDGSLWFLTNDTGNDRLLRVELGPRDDG